MDVDDETPVTKSEAGTMGAKPQNQERKKGGPPQPAAVKQSFYDAKIVPDILLSAPTKLVHVTYLDSGKRVILGNVLTPKEVRNQPLVNYDGHPDMFYTLLMLDPDSPSNQEPRAREWQHWLVGNILGNDIASGRVLTEYVGSGPPKNTGYHRFVFIVYEHSLEMTFTESIRERNNGRRGKFKTVLFAEKYNLGTPYAGNYFKAQYDDSVPALLKTFGLTTT